MQSLAQKILVVGGNGFIGSAVCKAALARGMEVVSISSSGRPYRTPKGHTPAWTAKVDWQKADALKPETYMHLLPEVTGVVHTLGTLLEDGQYKTALNEGNPLKLAHSVFTSLTGTGPSSNPLKRDQTRSGSYESINRDSALRVCEYFVSIPPSIGWGVTRPFVYISAEDIFRPVIPARYIETKREAEQGIEEMMLGKHDYRGVYIRPSLVYHAHYRPLTSPAAVLLDLSASAHASLPQNLPTPSNVLRFLASASGSGSASVGTTAAPSAFEAMANALTIPPIHVDHVAEAVSLAVDISRPDIIGAVGVRRMRDLIGWSHKGDDPAQPVQPASHT